MATDISPPASYFGPGRIRSPAQKAGKPACHDAETNGARAEALGAGPELVLIAASFLLTSAFVRPQSYP